LGGSLGKKKKVREKRMGYFLLGQNVSMIIFYSYSLRIGNKN
jgi:hypothetical protein